MKAWMLCVVLLAGCADLADDYIEDAQIDIEDTQDSTDEVEADVAGEDATPDMTEAEVEAEAEADVRDVREAEAEVEAEAVEDVPEEVEAETYDYDRWFGMPGGPCNCDSDCPDAPGDTVSYEGICYYGVCMWKAYNAGRPDLPCDLMGLACPTGLTAGCEGHIGLYTREEGVCFPLCGGSAVPEELAPCFGICNSRHECHPVGDGSTGADCDLLCQRLCWPAP